jgi:hypothetical protein
LKKAFKSLHCRETAGTVQKMPLEGGTRSRAGLRGLNR